MTGENPEVAFQSGQPVQGLADGCPVTAGQIRPAAGTPEQGIAGENGGIALQAYAAGSMAGGVQDSDVQSCQLQTGAFCVGSGIVQSACGHQGGHGQIIRMDVNLTLGFGGQFLHSAYVVEMSVGQQDGLQDEILA